MNTDWFDIIYRTSFSQKHNVSISGANDKVNYYFSGGLQHIPATVRGTGVKQFNGLDETGSESAFQSENGVADESVDRR